jgi:hypothetical protein
VTIHVAIGNSDNRLTQQEWSSYFHEVDLLVRSAAPHIHGTWLSASESPYQNACWGFELSETGWYRRRVQDALREIAGRYGQDSVAWNESETEFLPAIDEG